MIYYEDCMITMGRMLKENIHPDLIITSPPYNTNGFHNGNRHQGQKLGDYPNNNLSEISYQQWQIEVLNKCSEILSPTGSMFYNHKVRIKKGLATHPMEWILKSDFLLKQEIVWTHNRWHNSDPIRFIPITERIYWLTKIYNTQLNNHKMLPDVWNVYPRDGHHIMPEEIIANIISCFTPKLVYDPFGGESLTTYKVCTKNKIPCITSEIICPNSNDQN